MAPAARPAAPATRTSDVAADAAATPTIRLAVETIPYWRPARRPAAIRCARLGGTRGVREGATCQILGPSFLNTTDVRAAVDGARSFRLIPANSARRRADCGRHSADPARTNSFEGVVMLASSSRAAAPSSPSETVGGSAILSGHPRCDSSAPPPALIVRKRTDPAPRRATESPSRAPRAEAAHSAPKTCFRPSPPRPAPRAFGAGAAPIPGIGVEVGRACAAA
jgi:hypothetical protein